MILEFQLDRPKILWRQVAEQLRDKIVRGELPPGTKLPSTSELANQTGTNINTIHQALSDLLKEGLVTRARKVGTYVAERKPELSSLGVYHGFNIDTVPYAAFLQRLNQELESQAHKLNIVTRIWTDPRPPHEQLEILPALERAAREREVGGLITTISDPRHLAWLKKFPVPVAYLGSDLPSSVGADNVQFIEVTLESLKRQGCHSAGILVPYQPSYATFFRDFQAKCDALGLSTRPDWIFHPHEGEPLPDGRQEQFGYQAFLRLWDQKERPDGLIVFPDGMVRGALLALMSRQVRVPEQLKLVLHQNEGVPLLCPVPAAFAVFHISEVASALLRQVKTLFMGQYPQPIRVKFKIVAPASI